MPNNVCLSSVVVFELRLQTCANDSLSAKTRVFRLFSYFLYPFSMSEVLLVPCRSIQQAKGREGLRVCAGMLYQQADLVKFGNGWKIRATK